MRDKESYTNKRNPAFDILDEKYYELPSYREKKIAFIKDNFELIIKENK